MNAYVLNLLINNRRETATQLQPGGWQDGRQYLAEITADNQAELISLPHNTVLRGRAETMRDQPLLTLSHEAVVTAEHLLLRLFASQPPDPAQAPETPSESETAPPLTYEELEAYRSRKPQLSAPAPASPPRFQAHKKQVGLWQDSLAIWLIQDEGGGLHLTATAPETPEQFCETPAADITVRIQYESGKETFFADTRLSLTAPGQFVGLALDFGSESSQLTVKRHPAGLHLQSGRPGQEDLFKNVLSFHKAEGWLKPEEAPRTYYQQEEGTPFYKSLFFLKSDLSDQSQNPGQDFFIRNRKDNLKMLVNTHDGITTLTEQRFHQLPNLKLTHKYNELFSEISFSITRQGYEIPISLGDVKGRVYNSILRTLIESFLKKEFIQFETGTRKVRLVLLVPNIYNFKDVQGTQRLLNLIFQELAANEYQGRLLAWEVMTVSESDASLLGYVNKNPNALGSNRDYVIVDCGKGTTDLSVMRTGGSDGFTMQPVFRNGFAGAGNLITYAVFETLLNYIRASAPNDATALQFIRSKILAVLNSNDLERKTRFYQQLERLKFAYRESSPAIRAQWSAARVGDIRFRNLTTAGVDISALTDLLSDIQNLGDFYGYIAQAAQLIAENAAGQIHLIQQNQPDFNLGGVLLTGRAFNFQPLATAMIARLRDVLRVDESRIELLKGHELKDVAVKGVFNSSVRINAEKTGFPIEVYFGSETTPQPTPNTQPVKKAKGWQERFFQVMFNDLNRLQQAEAIIITDKALSLSRLLKSQILIGPNRYKLVAPADFSYQYDGNAQADLIFTPDGYLARQMNQQTVTRVFRLDEIFDAEALSYNMALPSLFPSIVDEEYLSSVQRVETEIVKLPIIPDPPPAFPAPTASGHSAAPDTTASTTPQNAPGSKNNERKGPIYF